MSMTTRVIGVGAMVMAFVWAASVAQAENTIYLKNKRSISGTNIEWKEGTAEYIVTTETGTIPVPKAQVARVVVTKPAGFDEAATAVKTRLYGQAIPKLEEIVRKYKGLNWDVEAQKLLCRAYVDTGDGKKASDVMAAVFASAPGTRIPMDLLAAYWKLLDTPGSAMRLRKELDVAIGTGSRETAAAAYMVRGNLFLKEGEESEALSDFLKITTLFQGEKSLQPEALYKAADLLDKAKDPRGADFRKKLGQEYPSSSWATMKAVPPAPAARPAGTVVKPAVAPAAATATPKKP